MSNQLMPIDNETMLELAKTAGKVATKPIIVLKDVTINIHNASTRNGLGISGLIVWMSFLSLIVYMAINFKG